MTWTVACGRVLLVTCLIALASCASQDRTKVCSANGESYLCPEDTECGGVQRLCVKPGGCGNGVVDQGEQCDDGNTRDGDGCSHVCLIEVCGNGILDPGEICDDGNTTDGDGCSATCNSKEICGNGIVDHAKGEVCDDGVADSKGDATFALKDGDGCSADCKSTEICGNHIIDIHEVCDDGNTKDGDGCSADCKSTEACDNGLPDPGEECDHGKFDENNAKTGNNNANDCRADCVINRCGDGYVDSQEGPHHEDCDGADPADKHSTKAVPKETLQCNIDCTFAHCGDGKVNRSSGEECDDHNNADGDGCSHDCKIEFCGNGVVDNGEPCDFSVNPATCNRDCTPSVCGDGKVNHAAIPPEQCDDGNTAASDGCSPLCQFERCGNHALDPGEQCDGDLGLQPCNVQTCLQETCGNGIVDNDDTTNVHEECDDHNNADGDGCSHDCHLERCRNGILDPQEQCDGALGLQPCNTATCLQEICGNGIRDDDAVTNVHEECDDHNTSDGDGCSHDCHFERCQNGILDPQEQCDGVLGLQPCNTATCLQEICGNGVLDNDDTTNVHEQCDDGNIDNGDGCSHDCKFEFCGDGIVNNHEQCDRALTPATCNLDCTTSRCGDGKINVAAGEQCDDSGTENGDGCSHDCKFERCGNHILDPGEDCDGPLVGAQPCSPICHQEICGNGIIDNDATVTPQIHEQCDDHNTSDGDGCSHDCKFEFCGDGILNNGELCDPALTPETCNLDCTLSTCGDGKVNPFAIPPEQCDDHNTSDGDGCSAHCKVEFCGDGFVNNHEVCDPSVDPVHCNLDCTASRCGDGKLNAFASPPEQCDDGGQLPGDGCSPDCQFERCGNGILDPGEDCDGPLAGTLQPCSPTCHQERCGNGILDDDPNVTPAIHEQCDLGPANSDQGVCTTACQLARCGDTFVQSGEQCDKGGGPGGNDDHADCTSACQLNVCGDGLTDTSGPDHIEQCDEGANNTDHPACAYNATCTGCSTQCVTLTVHHTCGDGVVDAPDEACDDRNTDACGSCNESCGAVTSKRAIGFILAVSGLELADGETFTLDDGVNPAETFEFDTGDGVVDGHVKVAYSTGGDAAAVRTAIEEAIQTEHDAGRLLIAPHPDPTNANDALALLSHDRPTSLGNHPITDTVGAPTFFAAGMFGGLGGNCGDTVGCGSDDDCASHHCNAAHVCDTPAPGVAPRFPAIRTARRAP